MLRHGQTFSRRQRGAYLTHRAGFERTLHAGRAQLLQRGTRRCAGLSGLLMALGAVRCIQLRTVRIVSRVNGHDVREHDADCQ
jgi:hypothetical protein